MKHDCIILEKQVAHLVRLTAKDLEDVASVLEESRRLQLSELASEREDVKINKQLVL